MLGMSLTNLFGNHGKVHPKPKPRTSEPRTFEPIQTCISSENFTHFTKTPSNFYPIDNICNIDINFLKPAFSLKSSEFFTFYHGL